MAAAGIEDLPTSFGASKRPRTARKKKQKAPRKKPGRSTAGRRRRRECFYEGDGLWYVGLVASFAGDDGVEVALVGSECVVVVPHYWLQKTALPRAGGPEEKPKQRLEDAPNPYAGLVDDKYWAQRFHYFSLYDCGVRLGESWYSVAPRRSRRRSRRVGGGRVVIDAFCGCGGNAIALASEGAWVVAVGVGEKADAVFLSPPWGGPDYGDDFGVAAIRVGGVGGVGLLALALAAAPRVAYLPRTTSAAAIAAAAARAGAARGIRVEAHYLNHGKAKTAYVGWPADHAWPKNGKT
ncbi:RNA trimethylguanosine synthase [Aureococcus anophagefferens]|nr:RNA trimethylguanosine synthase [Aureococcus anophagefferens]